MTGTIMGYAIASPEKQRKTALTILAFVLLSAPAGLLVLFYISRMETAGREQALAKVVSADTQ